MSQNASSSSSFRQTYHSLPGWLKAIIWLLGLFFGSQFLFMLFFLVSTALMVLPWVLMFGVGLIQMLLNAAGF